MFRRYIIPMTTFDVDLREWLPEITPYGVDTLDLVASVFRAAMADDVRYHIDVASYIKRVIEQQYYELKLHGSDRVAQQAFVDEVDKATIAAIELCDRVFEHMRYYITRIEAEEQALKPNGGSYYLSVEGYHGSDIVIRGDDEQDPRCV